MAKSKSQIQKFRDAARAHEASEDEAEFNRTLGRVGKAKVPTPEELDDIAKGIGNKPAEFPRKPRR